MTRMTIHVTDPEVPRALPHSRLYLDDIEQTTARRTTRAAPHPPYNRSVSGSISCSPRELRLSPKASACCCIKLITS